MVAMIFRGVYRNVHYGVVRQHSQGAFVGYIIGYGEKWIYVDTPEEAQNELRAKIDLLISQYPAFNTN